MNQKQKQTAVPNIPKTNAILYSEKETRTEVDADGNETTTVVEKTRTKERTTEPDYIKLYTKMWCEFNGIPEKHRPLFLELATRMSYANKSDLLTSQTVYTGEPYAKSICNALGWKQKDSLMKGLNALCKCGAIQKVNRAVYRINPSYAGRGEWKYNPKLERGGVEDLIATFSFKDGKVDTNVIWADDGEDNDFNETYREVVGSSPKKDSHASITVTRKRPSPQAATAASDDWTQDNIPEDNWEVPDEGDEEYGKVREEYANSGNLTV